MVDGKFDPFTEQDGSEMEDYEDDDNMNMLGTLEYQSRHGNGISCDISHMIRLRPRHVG